MKHDIHPAAEFFPLMNAEQLAELAADIRENGQREPATFWKGQLIDGRNRALACEQLGIDLDTCELDADTDPVKWVISHNLHRRHLSPSQKAMVGERLSEYYERLAKERMVIGGKSAGKGRPKKGKETFPDPIGQSRDQAGAAVGVSGKLIDAAKTVRTNGSPELVKKVESGEVSVTKAAKVAATVPRERQVRAVDEPQPKPERNVFTQLRKLFDSMTATERKQAACMWEQWLDDE